MDGRLNFMRTPVDRVHLTGSLFLVFAVMLMLAPTGGGAVPSSAKVAYVRRGWVYAALLAWNGTLRGTPQRLFRVPGGDKTCSLLWSGDGRLLAFTRYVPERLSTDLYVGEARPNARLKRLNNSTSPSFAPRGRLLAYVREVDRGAVQHEDVRVCDLTTGRDRLIRVGAADPCWSHDGRFVVVRHVGIGKEYCLNGPPLILDARTGHVRARFDNVGGHGPLLSPNGRYIAACISLSRPKFEPHIVNVRTRQLRYVPFVGEPVLDWSPDSRWLAWTRWIVSPEDEGSYLRREVWITSAVSGRSRKIGDGHPACFAPDGRHLLYVRHSSHNYGDLTVADLHGRHCHTLVRGVDSVFAVWASHGPYRSSRHHRTYVRT